MDETKECQSTIFHGPGHQSRGLCDVRGNHTLHHYRGPRGDLFWTDEDARKDGSVFSGFFNESPRDEDGEPF